MKTLPKLGDQEMLVLNWIAEHSPSSVREVAAHFDKELGLARTTILTVMERLRKKGLLIRKQMDGVFQYSAKLEKEALLQQRVADFVKQTLGGSLSPVLNYFSENPDLNADEIEQLKELVSKMEGRRGNSRK